MNYKIFAPQRVIGEIAIPASKSISNRALILNALEETSAQLRNVAVCNDTDAMVNALAKKETARVDIGAAGTAMRFLTAYLSVQEDRTVVIDGTQRMRQRPIGILVDALRSCGANIEYIGSEGFPPLKIRGRKLKTKVLSIPGNVSSQYISALLMVSPLIEELERITLTGEVISRPYIDMTLALMQQFGVETKWDNNDILLKKGSHYKSVDFLIENDWSAASYWFQIQALLPMSKVTLLGLFAQSVQGDSAVARLFEDFGIQANRCGAYLDLRTGELPKERIEMNLIDNPDLAQTIVVTACLLDLPFNISGLQTLKIKETDRIEALRTQLLKLGYVIKVSADYSLSWDGEKVAVSDRIEIETYDDHRMAMAFAPASVKFPGILIKDVDVVKKSYPDYWKHLSAVGFRIEED